MKILELEELLPRLDEDARDFDIWAEEFTRLMKLAEQTQRSLTRSGKSQDEEEEFPSMKKIKEALEEALEITPQDKYKKLQRLKIKRGEMEDYTESISYRPFARAQVITQRCVDLEDAFKKAELVERAEERKETNETVMSTLYTRGSTNDKLLNKNPKCETNNIYIRTYKCFRCNQEGHGVKQCPYSFKELVELEEKGQMSKESLNSQMEEGKLPL
ncbi:hypothetical protein H8356DRAFT_1277304 [Neocallimastix lanati (nom. inval.)]|nr:hypothetical protein H8356DRAFT_1277304 [Neocallimastix sp. JGI-2020a]